MKNEIDQTVERIGQLPMGDVKIESAMSYTAPKYIRTEMKGDEYE